MSEQETADRVAAAMTAQDRAIRDAGIRLLDIGPGRARTAMTVTESHVNGHGIAHGGYLFFLADAAFSFACNSHGVSTVASGGDIAFLRAARLGDELVAEARETALSGRSGIYDVTVTASRVGSAGSPSASRVGSAGSPSASRVGSAGSPSAGDEVVAEFRGRSRAVPNLPPPY